MCCMVITCMDDVICFLHVGCMLFTSQVQVKKFKYLQEEWFVPAYHLLDNLVTDIFYFMTTLFLVCYHEFLLFCQTIWSVFILI